MDVVLELFDTFMFDLLWSTLLPESQVMYARSFDPTIIQNVQTSTAWQFVPASEYVSFTPDKHAYTSRWPRDDWRRQLITLFLVTWYVWRTIRILSIYRRSNIALPSLFGLVVYFTFASMSYAFVFDQSVVHQTPNPARDKAGQYRIPRDSTAHGTTVPPRSPWLLQDIRHHCTRPGRLA